MPKRNRTVWVEQQIDPDHRSWGRLVFWLRTSLHLPKTSIGAKIVASGLYLRVDHPQYMDRILPVLKPGQKISLRCDLLDEWLIPPLQAIVAGYAEERIYQFEHDFIYQSNMSLAYCRLSISHSDNYKDPHLQIPPTSIVILPTKYTPLK